MGCTPSILHHHHHHQANTTTVNNNNHHRNGPANASTTEDGASVTTTVASTGSTSSPRSWVFKKGKFDKALKSNKLAPQTNQNSEAPANNINSPILPSATRLDFSVKVLLVFGKDDVQSESLCQACEKLGYECSLVRTQEAAVEAFRSRNHEIVIIDGRNSMVVNSGAVCGALRGLRGSQYSVFVTVVRRSFVEKEDSGAVVMLDSGFNRIMVETSSIPHCITELEQLNRSDVQPRQQLAATQAMSTALDKCSDAIHITDNSYKIQYLNRTSERLHGYTPKDLYGKSLLELNVVENKDLMLQQLQRGREWEGVISWRRKAGDSVIMHGRVIPIGMASRPPTHYVFIHEPLEKRMSLAASSTKRKSSADIKSLSSEGARRQSLAKLNNLQIEAPITKVISLITSVQENVPPADSQTLDKVVEILRNTDLYSPLLKDEMKIQPGDPVTSDLITALLSQGGPAAALSAARRSSSDSGSVSRVSISRGSSRFNFMSPQMRDLLDTALLWNFDIFRLEELSVKRPLVYLGYSVMSHFEVAGSLGVDESVLYNWLVIIEMNYNSRNTYHNSTHAADVMQATAGFLERERLRQILDPLDEAACLIAAAAHDVDHPGKSSAFLCNSQHELAVLYNDQCVLESHHSALTFKLTMSDDRVNIFKALEKDVYKAVRATIIDMILATEMTKHFEHLAKFVNVFSLRADKEDVSSGRASPDSAIMTTPENLALIKRMLIKCADVSNPTRPVPFCVEWAVRIADEYFNQTDEEKANGLPVVMPLFDRATCSIPKSQIGFMDFIINDMFEAWEAFIEMPELIQNMKHNYKFWKEKEKLGIHRLQDVVKMLRSMKNSSNAQK